MLEKVKPEVDFIKLEHEILDFWEKNQSFHKLMKQNQGNPKWSFQDGPITANNPMGVHHAWGRTLKDLYQRFKAMQGFDLRYQNGFDCQGLWVEVEVEKQLGIKSKTDIEELGIATFVQACKDRVKKYSNIQTEQSIRLGYWMDWDNSYFTMSDENNYTIWLFLKKCFEKGWIYKGNDVMPWCIDCGAALSEHEIATEGYKERKHTSVFVTFPLTERENEYLLVWTTTPWTLTSNVAAAVHPELDYIKIKQEDKILYLSKGCEHQLKKDYEILDTLKGAALVGWKYQGPFDDLTVQQGVEHKVIPWEEVSESEGTGIVHIAPGCGKEDKGLSKEHGLAVIAPLDEFGNYIAGFDWLEGKNVRDVTDDLIIDLKKKSILYKKEKYTHRYPVCWRHGSDLVFRLVDEWFIAMDELRYQIMEITKQIRWIPEFGMDRELDWLKNMSDWMISKKRFWGLALPIYECECGHFTVIGGVEELKEKAIEGWETFDGNTPHRPYIDAVKIKCEKCGGTVSRIKDVGNPWLDAGIVPYSTTGYLSNREYWKEWFPPDFVTECFPGQFRNWFYSLLAMSTVMENEKPFKTLLGHALVRDENGNEMHKSAGNAIWFEDAAETMGVDVMRWMFCAQNPVQNLNFGYKGADIIRRRIIQLWNSYSFFVNYAVLDSFDPGKNTVAYSERPALDRWMLSRLQGLIQYCAHEYDNFSAHNLMREVERFIDDLSNWYIRRSRRRFWKSEHDSDKHAAYHTLYEVLTTFIRLIAPVVPFFTESMYQNLVRNVDPNSAESIHHTSFPKVNPALMDERISKAIDTVIQITELGRAARKQENIRIRQPLQTMYVRVKDDEEARAIQENTKDLQEELNIRDIVLMDNESEFMTRSVKPVFAKLGPKYGKKMNAIKQAMLALTDPLPMIRSLEEQGSFTLSLEDGELTLEKEDVEIIAEQKPGYGVWEDKGYLVALDCTLTQDLLNEGYVRDLVRQVQNLRKQAELEIEDHIHLYIDSSVEALNTALTEYMEYLKQETLAESVHFEKHTPPSVNHTIEVKHEQDAYTLVLEKV